MLRVQTEDIILEAAREKVPSYVRGNPIRIPADLTMETPAARTTQTNMAEALNQMPSMQSDFSTG